MNVLSWIDSDFSLPRTRIDWTPSPLNKALRSDQVMTVVHLVYICVNSVLLNVDRSPTLLRRSDV